MEIMYEVNQHMLHDKIEGYTVTPIRIVRRGILEGCSQESITAISHDGRRFLGSPSDYFTSEAEAWESIRSDLTHGIKQAKEDVACKLAEIKQWKLILSRLPNVKHPARVIASCP